MTAIFIVNGWGWGYDAEDELFRTEIDGVRMSRSMDDWMRIFG